VADAGVREGDRVVEVGAGLGSLTVPLAEAGARVLAIEVDHGLLRALREVVGSYPNVRIEVSDAMRTDWTTALGADRWSMVSNLPYNVSVPLVVDLLQAAPIDRYVVMMQREVGERLVARPGEDAYGAVSVRVAYRADARMLRRVPADVFWPRPKVDSVLVRLDPRPPAVDVDPAALFAVVDEGFAERRKTMANALRRLGRDAGDAAEILRAVDPDPSVRAERLGLDAFAAIARAMLERGWTP
jgi:16S rRNA (adenine1518-N6/adenine1519-N6)-dimethyltransferase